MSQNQETLDRVKKISVQFSFSKPKNIPDVVKRLKPQIAFESINDRVERKSPVTGVAILEPTLNCSLENLLPDIEAAGFEMVDALYQIRVDAKDPRNAKYIALAKNIGGTTQLPPGRGYPMVRFVFVLKEMATSSEYFVAIRKDLRKAMESMYKDVLWRVRAFNNPLRFNGGRAISLNMEVRTPLFRPDGEPVAEWKKDENGERIGDAAVPLHAEYVLHMNGDSIELVTKNK